MGDFFPFFVGKKSTHIFHQKSYQEHGENKSVLLYISTCQSASNKTQTEDF